MAMTVSMEISMGSDATVDAVPEDVIEDKDAELAACRAECS